MINTLNVGNTNALDRSTLADQIAKRADINNDGSVSTGEFARFLTDVLTKIGSTNSSTPSAATAEKSLPPVDVAAIVQKLIVKK